MKNVKYSLDELIKELDDEFVEEHCFNFNETPKISKKNVMKRIKEEIKPRYRVLKRRYLAFAVLLIGITGVSVSAGVNYFTTRVEAINDDNRHLIGTAPVLGEESMILTEPGHDIPYNEETEIPENRIVKEVEDGLLIPGGIEEFIAKEFEDGYHCTEIIIPNGQAGIYTKEDGNGWELEAGQTITFNYSLYDGGKSLKIGVVKENTMCNGTVISDSEGEYSVTADESGTYYIYLIGYSSDYISLENGIITIK